MSGSKKLLIVLTLSGAATGLGALYLLKPASRQPDDDTVLDPGSAPDPPVVLSRPIESESRPREPVDPELAIVPDDSKDTSGGSRIIGRIFSDRGLPLAGARVLCASVPMTFDASIQHDSPKEGRRANETDAYGAFAFDSLQEGRIVLTALSPGFLDETRDVYLFRNEEKDVGTVTLRSGVVLSGRVVSSRGEGVGGAELYLVQKGPPISRLGANSNTPGPLLAETNPNGNFVTKPIKPGSWTIGIRANGYPPSDATGESLNPGIDDGHEFTLYLGLNISGAVTADEGYELDDLVAVAEIADKTSTTLEPGSATRFSSDCNPHGRFVISGIPSSLRKTRFMLAVGNHNEAAETLTTDVYAYPGQEDVQLSLVPSSWAAFGVRNAISQEPETKPLIVAEWWIGKSLRWRKDVTEYLEAGQEPGWFRLRIRVPRHNLAHLALDISVDGLESYYQQDLKASPGEVIDLGWIELPPRPVQRTKVLDALTGMPIPGAVVRTLREDEVGEQRGGLRRRARGGESRFTYSPDREKRQTDADGRAHIPFSMESRALLAVTHQDFVPSAAIELSDESRQKELTVRLHRGSTLRVTLLRNGNPVKDAPVSLLYTYPDHAGLVIEGKSTYRALATTNHWGECVFPHLRVGPHTVVYDHEAALEENVVIGNESLYEVHIEM